MITLEHVSKEYVEGVPALNDVSLNIEAGEFVFIVGDSGSGKSTMIKLLLKELEPTSGKLIINKKELAKVNHRNIPYYRRNIGCVFQDFRLLKDRNVYENVAFAQRVISASNRSIKLNVPKILSLVGLAAKYRSKPSELSGGEQQRVAIARALAKNPKLLLCDEPTGALDYQTGKSILKLLHDMSRQKTMTVVVITHNTALTPMADRVIHIKNGRVGGIETNPDPMPIENIEW